MTQTKDYAAELLAAEIVLCERRLKDFLECSWRVLHPTKPFIDGWHIGAICEHLEAVRSGQLKRLLIAVPPGTTKSVTISVVWPAWTWATRPDWQWLSSSHSDDPAARDAQRMRELIQSEWYRERWGNVFRLTTDQNVKTFFKNSRHGQRIAKSVGSDVTGLKGDTLFIDDPVDAKAALSDVERKSMHEWFDLSFVTRLNNFKTGQIVVIGQRTHEQDLHGHLLAQGGWEYLMLPEEFELKRRCTTSIGFSDPRVADGELLRAERFGPDEIVAAKRSDAINYATQHQQRPGPRGGSAFKASWLRYYSREGDYIILHHPERGDLRVSIREFWLATVADTASTVKTYSDFTAIGTFAFRPPDMLVWDMVRDRLEEPDALIAIRGAVAKHKPRIIAVGDKPKGVIQSLRRPGPNGAPALSVREMKEVVDKFTKSLDARNLARNGNLWLPSSKPWLPDYEAELLGFTAAMTHAHDDQVDVTSHAATLMHEVTLNVGPDFANQARQGLVISR